MIGVVGYVPEPACGSNVPADLSSSMEKERAAIIISFNNEQATKSTLVTVSNNFLQLRNSRGKNPDV